MVQLAPSAKQRQTSKRAALIGRLSNMGPCLGRSQQRKDLQCRCLSHHHPYLLKRRLNYRPPSHLGHLDSFASHQAIQEDQQNWTSGRLRLDQSLPVWSIHWRSKPMQPHQLDDHVYPYTKFFIFGSFLSWMEIHGCHLNRRSTRRRPKVRLRISSPIYHPPIQPVAQNVSLCIIYFTTESMPNLREARPRPQTLQILLQLPMRVPRIRRQDDRVAYHSTDCFTLRNKQSWKQTLMYCLFIRTRYQIKRASSCLHHYLLGTWIAKTHFLHPEILHER
jgi:hypothetical protein